MYILYLLWPAAAIYSDFFDIQSAAHFAGDGSMERHECALGGSFRNFVISNTNMNTIYICVYYTIHIFIDKIYEDTFLNTYCEHIYIIYTVEARLACFVLCWRVWGGLLCNALNSLEWMACSNQTVSGAALRHPSLCWRAGRACRCVLPCNAVLESAAGQLLITVQHHRGTGHC